MRLALHLFLFFSIVNTAFSQTHTGVVIDDNNRLLSNVLIRDTTTGTSVYSNSYGKYTLKKEVGSYFVVSLYGFETQHLKANELTDTIQLTQDARLLEGVSISSTRISSILTSINISVVDYLLQDDYALILYREGNHKRLVKRLYTGESQTFELDTLNARSLFEDCFGNVHLLTKKTAYQIWLTDRLSIVAQTPLSDFEKILNPCEALIDSTYIISSYSNHRQKYTLAHKQMGEVAFQPFFESYDKERALAAQALYNEIIAMYFAVTDPTSNIIINEMWSGKMIELAFTDTLVMMIGFYEKNVARPTFLETFKHNEKLITFDVNFDTIYTFTKKGEIISQIPFKNNHKQKPIEILQDKKNLIYYALYFEDGISSLSSINLEDGSLQEVFSLYEVPFAENIKIYDGRIYFTSTTREFSKLYSVPLE